MHTKATVGLTATILLFLSGCATTWEYTKLGEFPKEENVPGSELCIDCHDVELAVWKKSRHSKAKNMSGVGIPQFTGCGACHAGLQAHMVDPDNVMPVAIAKLTKSEQNLICGKCHFNRELMGSKAINPHARHALFLPYGFDGYKRQISCLGCHAGHSKKSDLLKNARVHVCFRCHKEAIVTMGAFQPFNYLTAGKVCIACHPAHGAAPGAQIARMAAGALVSCFVCHPNGNVNQIWFQPTEGGNGD